MATTPNYGFVYPSDSVPPDGPSNLKAFAESVDAVRMIRRYASAAVRSAQNPAPKDGTLSWLEDERVLEVYRNSAWYPVAPATTWKGDQSGTTAKVRMMMSSVQATTDANGKIVVTYPTAFPTATITAVVTHADHAQLSGGLSPTIGVDNPVRANGFDVYAYIYTYELPWASLPLRFNYIAIGY